MTTIKPSNEAQQISEAVRVRMNDAKVEVAQIAQGLREASKARSEKTGSAQGVVVQHSPSVKKKLATG